MIGGFFVFSGGYVQFYKSVQESYGKEGDSADSSRQHSRNGKTAEYHGNYPACLWRCPNCGNEKYKEKNGYTFVKCQECGAGMNFIDVRKGPKSEKPEVWYCPECGSVKEEMSGRLCKKCSAKTSTTVSESQTAGGAKKVESGCVYALKSILKAIGFMIGLMWLAYSCSMLQ
jgi:ribosomal protein S27E